MIKKSILYKIISIVAATSVLILVISLLAVRYYSMKGIEFYASNIISIIENQVKYYNINDLESFDEFIESTIKESNLRVLVTDLDGYILSDSFVMGLNKSKITSKVEITESEIRKLMSGEIIKPSSSKSGILGDTFIYSAKKISLGAENYILKVAINIDSVKSFFMAFLSMGILIIIAIILLLYNILPLVIDRILSPFNMIKSNLDNILYNKNIDKNITKYDDINILLDEINQIALKLKRNSKKYRSEKEKLSYVLDNIKQGIIALDKEKHIVFINEYATSLTGSKYSKPGHIIEVIREHVILEKIEKAIENNEYRTFDLNILNNSTIVELSVLPIVGNNEIFSLIRLDDVTDIRKLSVEKQDFFINASHELNTPLTSILGYSDILINNKDYNSDDSIKFMDKINSEALRMKDLVSDMLTLSKTDASWTEIIDENISINNIVNDVVSSMKMKAEAKNITIYTSLDDAIIFANKEQITQVVSNLISNAIKYTPENGDVKVEIKNVDDKVFFKVIDTGYGISQKYFNRIFERFFRIHSEKHLSAHGTGLGLTIVKNICNYYKVPILIKSDESVGTEITIVFNKIK